MWNNNNKQNNVIAFHQDFVSGKHSDFFQGLKDGGLFYWPKHSWETQLSKQEKQRRRRELDIIVWNMCLHKRNQDKDCLKPLQIIQHFQCLFQFCSRCIFLNLACGGSSVVQHSPHHLKVKGLSSLSTDDTVRETMTHIFLNFVEENIENCY